jgi:PilZ domain-containing protein
MSGFSATIFSRASLPSLASPQIWKPCQSSSARIVVRATELSSAMSIRAGNGAHQFCQRSGCVRRGHLQSEAGFCLCIYVKNCMGTTRGGEKEIGSLSMPAFVNDANSQIIQASTAMHRILRSKSDGRELPAARARSLSVTSRWRYPTCQYRSDAVNLPCAMDDPTKMREAGTEGRRSPRIVVRVPLEVQPLESLSATTAVINLHGALILSPVPWVSGTILKIRNQKTKRSIEARVVWTGSDDGTGSYKLGVEFEEPESGFWGSDYSLTKTEK